jgi:uncharacterized membrane protein
MSPRGAQCFIASVIVTSFLAATIAAFHGAWPALIYAALQSTVIVVAFHLNMRERNDFHELRITEETVDIRYAERGRVSSVSLPRHWTRVRLKAAATPLHPSMLLIESGGKCFEVAGFLTEADRRDVAQVLVKLIGPMGHSPPLETPERCAECPRP